MKRTIYLVICIGCLVLLLACSETEKYIVENKLVVNPAPSIEFLTFEDYLEESDVIAEIEIIENLGETNDPSPKTYFQANVITVIKGDESLEALKFMQGVNSDYIYESYIVFKVGQKLVLFLSKTTVEDFDEDMYWIRGDYLSVIKIDTVGDKEYANKLFRTFKDFPFENEDNAFKVLRYERERLFEEIANRMN